MADKELEIKLRATGGAAAAKEVEKLTEATEDLNAEAAKSSQGTPMFEWGKPIDEGRKNIEGATDAVEDLGTTVADTVPALDELTDASNDMSGSFNMGGAAAKGAGRGLAGFFSLASRSAGYIGVAIAAVKSYWDALTWVKNRLEEIDEVSNRSLPTLARTSQAAAIEQAELARWLEQSARQARDGQQAFDDYAKRLRALADEQASLVDAELGLELAQIDMGELNGNLSEAEAITLRFLARQSASERKLKTEREAIETELQNRRMQNEQDWQRLLDTRPAVNDANAALEKTRRQGASGAPELEDLVNARDAASAALAGASKFTSREAIAELEQAERKAQEELAEGFKNLIASRIEEVDKAIAAAVKAGEKVDAGQSDQRRLERELESVTTGPAAQANAVREREAAVRRDADLLRSQQAQEAADRAEAERLAKENEAAAAAAAQRTADGQGLAMASDIERVIASGRSNGADPALLSKLESIRSQLDDGTSVRELETLGDRFASIAQSYAAENARLSAWASQQEKRLATIEAQLKNSRR